MTVTLRRVLRTVFSAALLFASVFAGLASSVGTAAAESGAAGVVSLATPASHAVTIAPSHIVDPLRLTASTSAAHPRLPHRFFPRSGGGAAARPQGIVNAAPNGPQTAGESVLTKFAGMNESQQVRLFGFDQALEPPDVQIAAGPSNVVEMVNSTLSIWSKTGTLSASADLNTFYGVPSGYSFSDPRVVYDATSSRWFADGLAFDAFNDSKTYVAVSHTSDPSGLWSIYTLKAATNNVYDQPFLGLNDDKVVVSWNDYAGGINFSGSETFVLLKSDLVSAVAVHTSTFGPDANRFRIVPAVARSAATTEYMVYSTAAGNHLGVMALTGTPLLGNVAFTETDLAITALAANVPSPVDAGGVITTAIDNRFLSAVWQNGTLWTSGNDGCIPSGDSTARTCARLLQVSTSTPLPTLLQDFDAGTNGVSTFYPGVAMDQTGNLALVYSTASATINPSVVVSGQTAGTTGTLLPATIVQPGAVSSNGTRWGDYFGAAVDPANPATVWLNGEFAIAIDGSGLPNWGTEIAQVSITSGGVIGGKNLQLTRETSGSIGLSWQTGTVQAGYAVLRISSGGTTNLTVPSLPAGATSFVDSTSLTGPFACYVVVPVNGMGAALGQSDLLCDLPGYQSASGVPTNFSIALDQSPLAGFTWGAPAGEDGYVLVAVPSSGPQRQTILTNVAVSTSDNTGGQETCYLLASLASGGSTVLGNTDLLCGLPGFSTLSPASAPAPLSLGQVAATAGTQATSIAKARPARPSLPQWAVGR
ncbi:MAG: hypothetical protein ACR2JY_01415 [Chloroflexota bacterium]